MYNELRYEIIDEDFISDKNNNKFSFCFFDGINYSGSEINGELTQNYFNGDRYQRVYEQVDYKIVNVTFCFYDKESDITYSTIKEKDKDVIYRRIDSNNTIDISKEEYEKFTKSFIEKNNVTCNDIFNNIIFKYK